MAKKDEPRLEETRDDRRIEQFGSEMYLESAKALRQVGARVILSVGAAILIWIFGKMIFLPIAEGMTGVWFGYPVSEIISFIIVIALAIIIFTVFIDVRRLTGGMAGVLAYHFGKTSGEMSIDTFKNYRTFLDGILYVVIVSLAYMLFKDYLVGIDRTGALPAILLILIVIWSVFALWRSCKAIASILGRYTSQWAEELERQVKKV